MKRDERKVARRCAVYTRVSTDSGLEQDFNSLDNQREASEAYIKSQAHEGWKLVRERYDDGGFSGGSMERPALQKLLEDVRARKIESGVCCAKYSNCAVLGFLKSEVLHPADFHDPSGWGGEAQSGDGAKCRPVGKCHRQAFCEERSSGGACTHWTLELDMASLAEAFPDARGKLAVARARALLERPAMDARQNHDHGAALAQLGYTPIYLSYNSGLHISVNGPAFADAPEALLAEWPVKIED